MIRSSVSPPDSPAREQATRVLVPPSRPGLNPLLFMLRRAGLEVLEFPQLRAAPPPEAELSQALWWSARADWIVFSGEASATHWLAAGGKPGAARLAAIGHAAERALQAAGLPIAAAPHRHTPEAIVEALQAGGGSLDGKAVLLLRPAAAPGARADPELPEALSQRGATCQEQIGYLLQVEVDEAEARRLLEQPLAAVAFANPSAVRVLARAAQQLGRQLEALLPGSPLCAAAGPLTAEEARRHGLHPELVVVESSAESSSPEPSDREGLVPYRPTGAGGGALLALAQALVRRLGGPASAARR